MKLNVLVHAKTRAQLETIIARPTGSLIFHGARGIGKVTTARELATILNCLGDSAGLCTNCQQIAAGNFPDLIMIDCGDKTSITIEQIRGLTSSLALQPYSPGGTRVVVVDGAHLLTPEAQNALLKQLEEPPSRTVIILATERLEAMLLTVRSRCRTVHFVPPGEKAVAAMLSGLPGLTSQIATAAAGASVGMPGLAVSLAHHPAEIEVLNTLSREATGAGEQSLFNRLLLAGRLISGGTDLKQFGGALHNRIIASLRDNEAVSGSAAGRLDALERFRRALAAKVSPRVALERLMLELS